MIIIKMKTHFLTPKHINFLAMDIEYYYSWILCQGKFVIDCRLLTWTLLIGQFCHPILGEGIGESYFSFTLLV